MPSWIGPWEIVIVVVVVLLLFGPRKLPEFGSSLGKSIAGFKKGLKESKEEMVAAMKEDDPATDASGTATPAAPEAAEESETSPRV